MQFGNINSLGKFKYDGLVKVADVEITDSNTKLLLNGNSKPEAHWSFHSDGESTHTIVYLDYANFKIRNGSETLWSNDCTTLTGWQKYGIKGAAVSQVTFDSKSCFKFDAGANQTQVGIVSGVMMGDDYDNGIKNVGTGKWSTEFSYYGDVVGGYGANFDGFQIGIGLDNIYIGLTIWDGGMNCWDGSSHTRLGDPFVPDVWQTWRIEVDVPTVKADFYLNNVLTYSNVSLSTGNYGNIWYANTGQDPIFYNHACCTQDQYKFGDGCLAFDGTDDYITLADSDDWYFGNGDFTIDFWVRFNSLTNPHYIINHYADTDNRWHFYKSSTANGNRLGFYAVIGSVEKANYITANDGNFVVDTWYHFAVIRNGVSLKIFINGISQDLTEVTAIGTNDLGNVSGLLYVGQVGWGDYYLNGWLDEFRVSKGIARWTSDFDVATSEYPVNYETNSILISDALDGDTDGEYILESRIVAGGNVAQNAYGITINSDTGAYNYPRQALSGNNSSIAAGRTYWTQSMYICANGMTSEKISYNRLLICPKSGDIRTGFSEQSNVISGTTVTEVRLEGAGYLNAFGTVANISTLTAVGNGGGIGYGSRFILWKKEYHS